ALTGDGWRPLRHALVDVAALFMVPLLALFYASPARGTIVKDVRRWGELSHEPRRPAAWSLLRLFVDRPEFRNLFYYRVARSHWELKMLPTLLMFVCPQLSKVA